MEFLCSEYGGATHVTARIIGTWIDEKGLVHSDRHVEFEASFLGKERIPRLMQFLAGLAHEVKEKCIYLKLGQYTRAIYPIETVDGEGSVHLFSLIKDQAMVATQIKELLRVSDKLINDATPLIKREVTGALDRYATEHQSNPYRYEKLYDVSVHTWGAGYPIDIHITLQKIYDRDGKRVEYSFGKRDDRLETWQREIVVWLQDVLVSARAGCRVTLSIKGEVDADY